MTKNRRARIMGLGALGVIGITRGIAYLPHAKPDRLPTALAAISSAVPTTVWAVAWIIAGVATLAAIPWQRQSAAAPIAGLAGAWAIAYTLAWVGTGLASRAYLSGALYGGLAVLTWSWATLTAPSAHERLDGQS